jgi:hypothetical protein
MDIGDSSILKQGCQELGPNLPRLGERRILCHHLGSPGHGRVPGGVVGPFSVADKEDDRVVLGHQGAREG